MIQIAIFEGVTPKVVLDDIIALAKECQIGEEYDTSCDMVYCLIEDNKPAAVVAFKKVLFTDGNIYPRIEHSFGNKDVQMHIKGIRFLFKCFDDVQSKGYAQIWAYIKPDKDYMEKLALKCDFQKYAKDSEGNYLVKYLNQKRRL